MLKDRQTRFWRVALGTEVLCSCLKILGGKPEVIVQAGLGSGDETKILHRDFPDAEFVAIEGLARYVSEWKDDYPGKIIHGAIQTEHGGEINFVDARQRSKLRPKQLQSTDGGKTFSGGWEGKRSAPAVSFDGLLADGLIPKGRTLLHIDVEGSELLAFKGGAEFLKQVDFIWTELRTELDPREPWFPADQDIMEELLKHGFYNIFRAGMWQKREPTGDGLFVRRGWRRRIERTARKA